MEVKDYVYDEDRKEATIWLENVDLEELYDFLKKFNKDYNKQTGLDYHLITQRITDPIEERTK